MAKLVYGPLSPTKRGKRGRDHGLSPVPGPDLGANPDVPPHGERVRAAGGESTDLV
jgi:hypothetical protein